LTLELARLGDPIGHSSALSGFVLGAIVGVALILFAAAAIFTGGLCIGVLAACAAGIAPFMPAIGAALGQMMRSPTGTIVTGSPNVFVNNRPAARATLSTAVCAKDPALIMIAAGSATVFINDHAAARRTDPTTCGAAIEAGSPDVLIGDDSTLPEQKVAPEIPPEWRKNVDTFFKVAEVVLAVTGLAMLAKTVASTGIRAIMPCAGKVAMGLALGVAAGGASTALAQRMAGQVGHPVEVATGRKLLFGEQETDFTLAGRMPIVCNRFYASNLCQAGLIGPGWRLPWENHLHMAGETIIYTDAQGREISFPHLAPGQQMFAPAESLFWGRLPSGQYLLITLDQMHLLFSPFNSTGHAHLTRLENGCGDRLDFLWHSSGLLQEVCNRSGQRIQLVYEGDGDDEDGNVNDSAAENKETAKHDRRVIRIEAIGASSRGTLVQFAYDEHGQLSHVTNRLGQCTRHYAWENGLMVLHRNQQGLECRYRWQTIAGQNRVIEQRSNTGEIFRFDYAPESGQTAATNHNGQRAHWQYDAHHQITAFTDFDGLHYQISYDEAGNITTLNLPGNRVWQFGHDDLSRCVWQQDPLGQRSHTVYFGLTSLPSLFLAPDQTHQGFDYDARGLLTMQTDALGQFQHYIYDDNGALLTHIDAQGGERHLEWDQRGLLIKSTDCSGYTSTYEYDADGALIATTDALGHTHRTTRDALGRVTSAQAFDGSTRQMRYGEHGLLSQLTDANGHSQYWEYDLRGQIARHTDAMGHTTQYEYDPGGYPVRITNPNQAHYDMAWDAVGRITHEKGFDGLQRQHQYQDGLLAQTNSDGKNDDGSPMQQTITYRYDANARISHVNDASAEQYYEYDAKGNLLALTLTPSTQGQQQGIAPDHLRFEYDANGQLVAEHSRFGCVRTTFGALNHVTQMQLPQQQRIDFLHYGNGHVHQISFNERAVCHFERDELHREILRTQGALHLHTGYDATGRKCWQAATPVHEGAWARPSAPAPKLPTADIFSLAALQGPAWEQAVQQTEVWAHWHYRPNGELAHQRDSVQGFSQFNYDRAGFLRHRASANQQGLPRHENFAWDAAGNMQTVSQPTAQAAPVSNNRIPQSGDTHLSYDGLGNLVRKQSLNQTQHFEYDGQQQLICVRQHGAHEDTIVRFQYDGLGRRTEKRVETRSHQKMRTVQITWFIWHMLRMVQEVRSPTLSSNDPGFWPDYHDPSNTVRTYLYDPAQTYVPLACVDQPNHVDGVDGTGGDVGEDENDPAETIYYYHTDQIGTPTAMTDEEGKLCWAARYGAWGQLEQQVVADGIVQNLRYQGEYADEEIGIHYNTFRYYDPQLGRFINQDPLGLEGGLNAYGYAPNPTGWIDPWGWINLNANAAQGNFGVYKIEVNGQLYKFGKADLSRITQTTGLPTRIHQQIRKLKEIHGKDNVKHVILTENHPTTQSAKTIETQHIQDHFNKTGVVPPGNEKSFKPQKTGCA
jgi:RHS repeat-associated protein